MIKNQSFRLNRLLFLCLLLGHVFVAIGCTQGAGQPATVRLQFPDYKPDLESNRLAVSSKAAWSAFFPQTSKLNRNAALDTQSWGLADPTSITGFGCFAAFVSIPDQNTGVCTAPDGSVLMKFGQAAGLVAPGGELSITLQSGQQATIYLAGFALKSGATCEAQAVGGEGQLTDAQYSQPFLLGQATATIKPGSQSITIDANYTAASPRINDCNFGRSGGGGNQVATQVALLNSFHLPSEILSYQSGPSPSQKTCIPIFVQAQTANSSGAQPPPATTITVTETVNPANASVGHFYYDQNCSAGTEISFPMNLYYQEQILYYESVTTAFSTGFQTNLQISSNLLNAGPQLPVSMKLGIAGLPVSTSTPVITQRSIVPWSCNPLFLVAADANGQVSPFVSGSDVPPVSTNISYFTDSYCTRAFVSPTSISLSKASAQYYFQYSGPTGTTVTLPGSGGTYATFEAQGTAPTATDLMLTATPFTFTVGQCSTAAISLLDNSNRTTANLSASPIAVTLSGPAGTYYPSPNCSGTALTNSVVTVNAQSSSTTFSFKTSTPWSGPWQASAILNGLNRSSSIGLNIAMAPPSNIRVRMVGQSLTGTALSPNSPSTALFFGRPSSAEIILTDASNNLVPWQGTMNLSYQSPSNGGLPGPNLINFTAGDNGRKTINLNYNAASYSSSSLSESITASITNVPSGSSGYFFVQPYNVARFGVLGYMASGTDSCSPFVVYAADNNGDPFLTATANSITTSLAGGSTIFTGPGCTNLMSGNSILIGSNGVSAVYYLKTPSSSATTSLTFNGGALAAMDGTWTTGLGQNTLHSGAQGVGGANFDISVQTPGSVALGACFPILVDVSSDYGNQSPRSTSTSFAVTAGSGCPTVFSDSTCNTPITVSDLLFDQYNSTKLLFSKAISSSLNCTITASGGGAANSVSPLPNFSTSNHPVIH